MPANARVTPTDFVQDYAAKRQAQLERAKRIREERLQQQQQQPLQGGGGGNGSAAHQTVYNAPEATPTAAQPVASDNGRRPRERRILQVVEEDFTRATQAGIITPDQARQLWAMFSNQIIRVAASHPVVGLEAMLALSHATSSHSSQASSHANGTENGHGFGGSISMESLRRSIAQFKKEQQQRQQQQQQQQQQKQRAGPQEAMPAYGEHDYEPEEDEEGEKEEERGAVGQGGKKGRGGGRPEWNFDTAVIPDPSAPPAVKEKKTRKNYGANEKASKAHHVTERAYDEHGSNYEESEDKGAGRAPPRGLSGPALGRKNSAPGKTSAARADLPAKANQPAVTVVKRPPGGAARVNNNNNNSSSSYTNNSPSAPIASFDDIPVGGHSGGGEMAWQEQPYAAPERGNHTAYNARAGNAKGPANAVVAGGGGGGGVVDVNEEIAQEAAAAAAEPLRPCSCCGRTFRVSLLARHEALCRKQSKKPRRAFDTRGQRLDGLEAGDGAALGGGSRYTSTTSGGGAEQGRGRGTSRTNGAGGETTQAQAQKMAKWRLQHEQFQAAMRAVRSQAQAEKEFGPVGAMFGTGQHLPAPPPPLPAELDSRVPCPHCGRKFAEETAKRHIPHCANTIAKPKGIRPIRR